MFFFKRNLKEGEEDHRVKIQANLHNRNQVRRARRVNIVHHEFNFCLKYNFIIIPIKKKIKKLLTLFFFSFH